MKFLNNIEVGSSPNFTLPLSDGSANQILQTNGSGTVTWVDLPAGTTDTNDYVTAAAFNTATGVVTLTVQNQTAVTVNLDGRYLTAHPNITAASSVDNSGVNFIQDITLDSNGHVTGLVTAAAPSGTMSTWYAGADSHTGAGSSSMAINDGEELGIKGAGGITTQTDGDTGEVTIDGSGITGSYTWTVHDDTGSVAVTDGTHLQWGGSVSGSGTSGDPYVFPSHPTISAATSVDNSGNTFIQDITLDSNGHITGLTSAAASFSYDWEISDGSVDSTVANGSTVALIGGAGITTGNNGAGEITFSVKSDLRDGIRYIGEDTNDYIVFNASSGTQTQVYVDGSIVAAFRNNGSPELHCDGDIIAYSTTISDARLKEDVETIQSASEKVSQLRGVEYTWKKGSRKGQREIGLIAQEVEEVVPSIVREKELVLMSGLDDSSAAYKTVDYEKLIALLIESNKEQQDIIAQLEERVIDLENRL